MTFFAELKRRNVLRAGALYLGAVWALAQGISQLGPSVGAPDWVTRWFLVAACIGFPFAMLFSWFYEWTSHGILRESDVEQDASVTRETGKKMDRWIIAVLTIAVVLLLTNTFVWRKGAAPGQQPSTPAQAKSIAVLPFVNMSGDPNQKYFSDGITEEILNALAQIPDLKVAGRTSAFQFSGKDEDLRKVGAALGVANVLEGSVQKAGDEVRITVQLIDAHTGYQLWSEKYDRKLTNIFAIEDDISSAIAGKLRVQLTGGAGQVLVSQLVVDPRAHDFYLSGLALLDARAGLPHAVAAFQNAVKIAPDYAQAWGALAEAEALLPGYQPDVSTRVAYASAKSAAERALAIDPNIAEAYVALSMVYGNLWAKRDQAMQRALQLAPGNAEVVYQHAYFLLLTGNLEAALHEMDRALRLNPLSPIIAAERVETLLYLHRYDDALRQADATIDAHPDFPLTYGYAALVTIQLHHYADAAAYVKRAASMQDFDEDFGIDAASLLQLIHGISDPAQRAAALHTAERLASGGQNQAEMFCALGAHAQALASVERGLSPDVNPDLMAEVMWSPMLDPIRNDPRFTAVLEKMGLPYKPQDSQTKGLEVIEPVNGSSDKSPRNH